MILENINKFRKFSEMTLSQAIGDYSQHLSLIKKISADKSAKKVVVFEQRILDAIQTADESLCNMSMLAADGQFPWSSWGWAGLKILDAGGKQDVIFVVTAGFILGLDDPRPLLYGLKQQMLISNSFLLVLKEGEGVPFLNDFLLAEGFSVESSKGVSTSYEGVYFLEEQSYRNYLVECGIKSDLLRCRTLILTTEDATMQKTGGIGTYIKNVKNINETIAVLVCDRDVELNGRGLTNTFIPKMFVSKISDDEWVNGGLLVEFVRAILFLLPNISLIEFQDHRSIGLRVVQAKRSGGLPIDVSTRVFLHGNVDYLKYGANVSDESLWYSYSEAESVSKDRYIFKYADECVAPSIYLSNKLMIEEYGYELAPTSLQRLPFDLGAISSYLKIGRFEKVRNIVFIGKYSELKGWPDFVRAVQRLALQEDLSGVSGIYSLAPGNPAKQDYDILSGILKYRPLHLSHHELLAFVDRHRADSIFVVPSRGENYPFVVLEQLLLGTRFVAYNTGGAVEVVDNEDFVKMFFCQPGEMQLAQKIKEILSFNEDDIERILKSSSRRVYERQIETNLSFSEGVFNRGKKNISTKVDVSYYCDVSVVVPVYNTNFDYLKDLLVSLKNQSFLPFETIIINDGSAEDYSRQLVEFIASAPKELNCRVVHQANLGLSGARNRGSRESQTKYTLFIDSDDILLPGAISKMRTALEMDRDLVAVNGFYYYFDQRSKVPLLGQQLIDGHYWKPIGAPEAKALSLFKNNYINANAMFRTERIKDFGGWDDSDKATWEDWAFYTKIAWAGGKFLLVPDIVGGYRNTPGSMSKTYNRFFGKRRVVRNVNFISRFDANVIMSMRGHEEGLNSLGKGEIELIMFLRRLCEFQSVRFFIMKSLSLFRALKKSRVLKAIFFKIVHR